MTDYKTLKQAAESIGVHWRTVYRWTLEGKIAYIQHRRNGPIYIPFTEIERIGTPKSFEQLIEFTIYFIQAENDGLIKIGVTQTLKERFNAIQTHCPVPLKLLATINGDEIKEKEIHEKFSAYRKHGEWFEPAPELIKFIKNLPY